MESSGEGASYRKTIQPHSSTAHSPTLIIAYPVEAMSTSLVPAVLALAVAAATAPAILAANFPPSITIQGWVRDFRYTAVEAAAPFRSVQTNVKSSRLSIHFHDDKRMTNRRSAAHTWIWKLLSGAQDNVESSSDILPRHPSPGPSSDRPHSAQTHRLPLASQHRRLLPAGPYRTMARITLMSGL